jgi:hypothetical protein
VVLDEGAASGGGKVKRGGSKVKNEFVGYVLSIVLSILPSCAVLASSHDGVHGDGSRCVCMSGGCVCCEWVGGGGCDL